MRGTDFKSVLEFIARHITENSHASDYFDPLYEAAEKLMRVHLQTTAAHLTKEIEANKMLKKEVPNQKNVAMSTSFST